MVIEHQALYRDTSLGEQWMVQRNAELEASERVHCGITEPGRCARQDGQASQEFQKLYIRELSIGLQRNSGMVIKWMAYEHVREKEGVELMIPMYQGRTPRTPSSVCVLVYQDPLTPPSAAYTVSSPGDLTCVLAFKYNNSRVAKKIVKPHTYKRP